MSEDWGSSFQPPRLKRILARNRQAGVGCRSGAQQCLPVPPGAAGKVGDGQETGAAHRLHRSAQRRQQRVDTTPSWASRQASRSIISSAISPAARSSILRRRSGLNPATAPSTFKTITLLLRQRAGWHAGRSVPVSPARAPRYPGRSRFTPRPRRFRRPRTPCRHGSTPAPACEC